ncbi:MAG: NADH-quinone oxidoreductase subunit C [Candidatus Omnitrophica bacterium]|nr:NADH-quinone oxidoreductase subunit C [Candidatus Omnitrophota bacterium]
MKSVFEGLREKFPDSIKKFLWESGEEVHLLVTKDSIVQIAAFLIRTLRMRFLFLFAANNTEEKEPFQIRYVFSFQNHARFLILEIRLGSSDMTFPSLTPFLPQANWQEREIEDLFGIRAEGHPAPKRLVLHEDWPKGVFPLRKEFALQAQVPRVKGEYPFDPVMGEGVFEIPVGPVHAGIIEPGHFRFSSAGESILKLEIRHFYTHKGIEKLGEGKAPSELLCLAERISGDNSLAHAASFVQAIEALSGTSVPERAKYLRVIFLELERLYNHVSDIAGIALDAGFGFGSSQLMRLKERFLVLNERLSGTRLARSVIVAGGVKRDLTEAQRAFLLKEIRSIKNDFDTTIQLLWQVSSLCDRIDLTGAIKPEIAEALGGVGPIARASGIDRDLRRDHPYAAYEHLLFLVPVFSEGDVESRMKVKIQEVFESFKLIDEALGMLPEGPVSVLLARLPHSRGALGYVESPRGECFHWLETDAQGKISRWKIQSPSFSNWPLIEYAVLENIVPDFPLINKSLNLSYAGNDR